MIRLALLLALLLTACAAPQPLVYDPALLRQPADGLPRVFVDGQRVIAGHKHDDPRLALDACEGCAIAFRQAVDGRLREILAAEQQAKARRVAPPASVAAPSSPTAPAPQEAPK